MIRCVVYLLRIFKMFHDLRITRYKVKMHLVSQLHCNSSSVLIIGHLVRGLFRAFIPLSAVVQC